MKVLHIGSEVSWRGGENQVQLLITGLNEKGVENFIAYPVGAQALSRISNIKDKISFRRQRLWRWIEAWRIARFCKKNHVDIIDAHSSAAHQMALHVRFFFSQVKIVVHRRVNFSPPMNWLSRTKYFHPSISCFVAISSSIAEVLSRYGVAKEKIKVIPSAIKNKKYLVGPKSDYKSRLVSRHGVPQQKVLIGSASALTKEKGLDVLLRALGELRKDRSDFFCLIAGEGPLRSEFQSLIHGLSLSDSVQLVGFMQDIENFLGALDVFVLPSSNEGLGTIVQEAMYSDALVVGSRVGGIPEMVVHEETGFLFESGDAKGLARELGKALDRVLTLDGVKMRKTAHAYIEKHFSYQRMVDLNYQVYSETLDCCSDISRSASRAQQGCTNEGTQP